MLHLILNNGHAHAVQCDTGPMHWLCPYCHKDQVQLPGLFDEHIVCGDCRRTACFRLAISNEVTYFVTWRPFDKSPIKCDCDSKDTLDGCWN